MPTSALSREPRESRPPLRSPRHTLVMCPPGDDRRGELETFIRDAFARSHGAHVCGFMPMLVALRDRESRLRGVVGYRPADRGSLYLEQYLDAPAEDVLTAATGTAIARAAIVEVGNLAASNCRAAHQLASLLPRVLLGERYEWLVFTGTRVVREILAGLGAPLVDLGAANPSRVAGAADHWGSYYEADPRVMAGFLPHARVLAPFARGLGH